MDADERRYIIYHIDHLPRRITQRVHSHRQYDKMDAIRFLQPTRQHNRGYNIKGADAWCKGSYSALYF